MEQAFRQESVQLQSSPLQTNQAHLVQQPFFICCAGRSGSTHLGLMLNNHPQLSCLDEIGFVTELVSDEGDIPDLDAYHRFLSLDRIFFTLGLKLDKRLDFYGLANDFLLQGKQHSPLKAVGSISHFDFIRLLRIWPNARFIHLTRDGRDVTYSWLKELELDRSAWFAAQRWQKAEQAWDKLVKELAPQQYIELTYEDFVANVPATLRQVCSFVGVPYDEQMLEFAEEGSYFQYPDSKFIGLWRSGLSRDEIRLAEARIAQQLVSRGYQLSELPPLKVGRLDKILWKLQAMVFRQWHKVGRLGPKLYALDLLVRRVLPFEGLRKAIQQRINQRIHAQLIR